MPTPREQAQKIGGASTGPEPKYEVRPPERQKDNVNGTSQKERLMLDTMPPKPQPKPFR